jgi:hypothetical protein
LDSIFNNKSLLKTKNQTVFNFYYEDNNSINGKIYFLNNLSDLENQTFFKDTINGSIVIENLENIPKYFSIIGNYDGLFFSVVYDFPLDYKNYDSLNFLVTKKNLNNDINEDDYKNIEEIHWGHMPISYKIECFSNDSLSCIKSKDRVILALNSIQSETSNVVSFVEKNETPDINVYLFKEKSNIKNRGELVEGFASPYFYKFKPNLISSAEININVFGICKDYPAMEIHEILHTFGFGHTVILGKVMSRYASYDEKDCPAKIEDEIIANLTRIYTK